MLPAEVLKSLEPKKVRQAALDKPVNKFAFSHPNPVVPNLAMLYKPEWDLLIEGANWEAWWIQNSRGFSYAATPFLQEPWLSLQQRSYDLNSAKLAEIVAGTPQSNSSADRPILVGNFVGNFVANLCRKSLSAKTCDKVSDKEKNPAGFGVARLAPPSEVFY